MWEGYTYITVSWIYLAITLCLIVNRLYVRAKTRSEAFSLRTSALWSDILIVFAWICVLIDGILLTVLPAKGWAGPDPRGEEYYRSMEVTKMTFTEGVTSVWLPLYCIKAAILLFYLELTPPVLRKLRWAVYTGLGLTAIGGVFSTFYGLLICPHLGYKWSRAHRVENIRECPPLKPAVGAVCMFHIFTDVYIYIIPFFIIRHASIRTFSQRMGIYAMFGAGFLLLLTTLPYIINNWHNFRNPWWNFWRTLHEQTFAIALACMPALRKSFTREKREGRRRTMGIVRKIRRGDLSTVEVADGGVKPVVAVVVEQERGMRHAGVNTTADAGCNTWEDGDKPGFVDGGHNV